MKDQIIPIVQSYLKEKKEYKKLDETKYIRQLKNINVPENRIPDFILNMEDVWIYDQFLEQKIKQERFKIYSSYLVSSLGFILTLITFIGEIFEIKAQIIFYGLIATGFLALFRSKASLSKLKLEREIQKYKWKEWQ